jgi:hypothetical protein
MYTEIKQGTTFRIPVRLLELTTSNGKTGVTSPVVSLNKQGTVGVAPSVTNKSITNGSNWYEVDAVNMPGVYVLDLTVTDTNTVGNLVISVKDVASDCFVGTYAVVDTTVSELNATNVALEATIDTVRKMATNRTKIDTNQNKFIVFDDDGVAIFKTFNLYDATHNASSNNIYERTPV